VSVCECRWLLCCAETAAVPLLLLPFVRPQTQHVTVMAPCVIQNTAGRV